jgi:hypothetical protein
MLQEIPNMTDSFLFHFFMLLPAFACCLLLLPAAACSCACSLHFLGSSESGMPGQGAGARVCLCLYELSVCCVVTWHFSVMSSMSSQRIADSLEVHLERFDNYRVTILGWPVSWNRVFREVWGMLIGCVLFFPLSLCLCVCVFAACVFFFFLWLFLFVPWFLNINIVMDWPKTSPWQ